VKKPSKKLIRLKLACSAMVLPPKNALFPSHHQEGVLVKRERV
jgi:hypothetical protein